MLFGINRATVQSLKSFFLMGDNEDMYIFLGIFFELFHIFVIFDDNGVHTTAPGIEARRIIGFLMTHRGHFTKVTLEDTV